MYNTDPEADPEADPKAEAEAGAGAEAETEIRSGSGRPTRSLASPSASLCDRSLRILFGFLAFLVMNSPMHASEQAGPFTSQDFAPTQRGGRLLLSLPDQGEVELYKDSYALVIGISQYRHWPKLPGVQEDVLAVREVLRKHGFRVGLVQDPTHDELERVFTSFIHRYGLETENRLLIYFAGHGHTIKSSYGEQMGYLVPVDAPEPARSPEGFLKLGMPMSQIEVYARQIQSKHVIVLFDSCFAGTIFTSLRAAPPPSIVYQVSRPVRQFISSGAAEEAVPDQSIFRRQLVAALEGEADLSRDGYVTGEELGQFLQDSVVNYSRSSQHPQYGKLRHPELDKGDVVFELTPRATENAAPSEARGSFYLNALPPARIRINGKDASQSPIEALRVRTGVHKLLFLSADGRSLGKDVQIRSDEIVRCTAFFEENEVRCRTSGP